MTNKKKDISNKNYAIVPGNDCAKKSSYKTSLLHLVIGINF